MQTSTNGRFLSITTLELRFSRVDLIEVIKILSGFENVNGISRWL